MKQIVTIILLLVYFSTAFGAAINVHYCGKQVAKVSILNFSTAKGCNCNPGNDAMDCCRNYKLYNKADNHKNIQIAALPEASSVPVSTFLISGLLVSIPEDNHIAAAILNPLRSCSQPVYLLNRVFRI